jgi:drug/metabolite transporter (DMT)-like permease
MEPTSLGDRSLRSASAFPTQMTVVLPLVMLVLATSLFALGPAVLKLLMQEGAALLTGGAGTISFCNVLFVGNLCAGLVVLAFTGIRAIVGEIARVPARTKLYLLLASIVSAIYPALLFTALEQTTIINIVLLSRFNGIVYVLLALLFLRTPVRRADAIGYAIMAVGVSALVIVNNGGLAISKGDALVLTATLFFGLTEIIHGKVLAACSIATYMFVRNFFSAIIFFAFGLYLFGVEHFADAFAGDLWVLMFVYAGVTIVAAQLFWLKATRVLPVKFVANIQLLNPAISIAFAFALLNEVPSASEWTVMAIVLVGMLLPKLIDRDHAAGRTRPMMIDTGLVAH